MMDGWRANLEAIRSEVRSGLSGVELCDTKPILTNVKLVAEDGLLTATATDLNIAVQRSVPCEGDFAVVVEPKRLAGLLSELGNAEVEFREDGDSVVLKSGKDRWTLPTMLAGDFPEPSAMPSTAVELTMQAGAFKQVYKRTVFAADDRPHEKFTYKGVRIEVSQSKFAMMASDGNLFAMCDQNCSTGAMEGLAQCLVPIRPLQLFMGNIKSAEEALTIRLTPKRVYFVGENATVATSLIGGRFPPYRAAMPKKFVAKVNLSLLEFASKVRQATEPSSCDRRIADSGWSIGMWTTKTGNKSPRRSWRMGTR